MITSMNSNDQILDLNRRMNRMEREHYLDNDRLVNWCYALTGIIVMLLVVLFVIICDIYYYLGVIPDLV